MPKPLSDDPAGRGAAASSVLREVLRSEPGGQLPAGTLEKLVEHQMSMERAELRLEWAGLISALTIALSFLAVSAGLIVGGHEVSGTLLGTVDLVALATVFVKGRQQQP